MFKHDKYINMLSSKMLTTNYQTSIRIGLMTVEMNAISHLGCVMQKRSLTSSVLNFLQDFAKIRAFDVQKIIRKEGLAHPSFGMTLGTFSHNSAYLGQCKAWPFKFQ